MKVLVNNARCVDFSYLRIIVSACEVKRGNKRKLFLIIKTNEMHHFSNLFWCTTLYVSERFTVHHQGSSTVYTAIGICHTGYADCLLAGSGWNNIPS